jgi:L-malate glycosyltransferase
MLNNIVRLLKRLYKLSLSDEQLLKRLKEKGLKIGLDCRIYTLNFGSEPYLINIGNHTTVSNDVQFVTHDGGVWVFRENEIDIELVAPIKIGSNVFIGTGSIILPNTIIEDNVIVGAGSIVKGTLENGYIYAGVIAKKIKTIEEYRISIDKHLDKTKTKSLGAKKNFMKTNLLIIIPQLDIGGAEKQLLLHIKYLNKDKYNIYLVNIDANANLLEKEFNLILTENVINIHHKSKFLIIKTIVDVLVDKEINIVHTWLNNDWGRIAGIYYKIILRNNIKIIASERNDMFMSNRKFSKLFILINYILSYVSDVVTFNSSVPMEKLNKFFYSSNTIKFIPNGIEINEKIINNQYDADILKLVIVARLNKIKNHIFLLEAINQYKYKSKILLNVVGDGEEYNSLLSFVKKNDMQNIIFHGELKAPRKIIINSDIGVLVSHSEGFSNAILEYMLYGKAIIATDVGSNKLCVTNNGFLVENIKQLHVAFDKYLNDNILIEHQNNSLNNIVKFDINNVTLEYERIYDEV